MTSTTSPNSCAHSRWVGWPKARCKGLHLVSGERKSISALGRAGERVLGIPRLCRRSATRAAGIGGTTLRADAVRPNRHLDSPFFFVEVFPPWLVTVQLV